MKRYKVQSAFYKEIAEPNIYSQEEAAKEKVAYLLGSWLSRHLAHYIETVSEFPAEEKGSEEFKNGLRYVATELPRLISEGSKNTGLKNRVALMPAMKDPYKKYAKPGQRFVAMNPHRDLFNEFVSQIAEVAVNKASVKGIDLTEEQFRKALQETLDVVGPKYAYLYREDEQKLFAELREGILSRLFPKTSIGLGAFQTWLVQYADIGGAWHPGRHTNETRAKEQAREYLERLIESLGENVQFEEVARGKTKYVKEAHQFLEHIQYLLDNDMIWAAYLDLRQFQDDWSRGKEFPLAMSIGTMRVIPEPESEEGPPSCPGRAC